MGGEVPEEHGLPERLRAMTRLNLRDLGTLRAADGRPVATGQVFRCAALVDLPDDEVALLHRLGIRTVLDLRTERERVAAAGLALPGAEHIWLDVIGESGESGPASLAHTLRDPVAASLALGGGRAADVFVRSYRELVSNPLARSGYARLMRSLDSPDAGPVLFHCSAGKDRTGWAAAMVLSTLGVPRDAILADYLETNGGYVRSHSAAFDRWKGSGGDLEVLAAVISARPEYLASAFDELDTVYGGIEGYLVDGLELDEDLGERVRARLLVGS